MSRPRFIGLMLALVTLLVYLPVRHHPFVLYDDDLYVTDNPVVQSGLTWAGVHWALTTWHASNWHPLTWLSHMLDAQLFGPGASGPHVVNLLFHVANTVLLFILLRQLTGALWRSAWVAALFALHPLHVESVAWVAERKDVLSAFFFLLTLWAYANYADRSRVGDRRSAGWYGGALGFFALGLMSKPMLVTLPFVLLLLDYWPLRRWELAPLPKFFAGLAARAWEKAPFFLLGAGSSVVTFIAQKQGGAVESLASYSLSARMENALVAYARYLGKTFWPADLAVFYPHPGHWPGAQVVLAALLVAGLCLGVLGLGRRFPFAVTGWFWFFGMLIPTIGLLQVGDQSLGDRYTYLPLIGLFILLVWGAGEAFARGRWPQRVIGLAAGLVLVAAGVRTEGQLYYWRSSESLFRRALAVTKGNYLAHYNLGDALLQEGQTDEAMVQFQKALEIRPDDVDIHNNLGNVLLQKGRVDEAMAHFQKALEIQPNFAKVHYNLGNILLQKGRTDEAILHFQEALDIRPDLAEAHGNLGWVLLQKGRVDESIAHDQKALAIQPGNAMLHNNLADALLRKGQTREALAHLQTALELDPDNARALSSLAWVLATHRDASVRNATEAVRLAERLGEITGRQQTGAMEVLGAAYAEAGRFDQAIQAAQKALALAGAAGQPDQARQIQAQLTLYQSGHPYRE